MAAMMENLRRVDKNYDGEVVAGCFPIPTGGRTVAIVEFIFCGVCFLLLILAFVGSSISSGIFGLLFIIGLVICAFFLMKAVNDGTPILTLPYIIAKIIHVILQVILVIILVGEVVAASSSAARSSNSWMNHYGGSVHLGLVAAILNLLFHILWLVFGVIGVIVAFKVRNFFLQYRSAELSVGNVVVTAPSPQHAQLHNQLQQHQRNHLHQTTYYYDSK